MAAEKHINDRMALQLTNSDHSFESLIPSPHVLEDNNVITYREAGLSIPPP